MTHSLPANPGRRTLVSLLRLSGGSRNPGGRTPTHALGTLSRNLWLLLLPLSYWGISPMFRESYIEGADAFAHLFRLYEVDLALRDGVLFPRWIPDFLFGYGYPLLNFYAPLS